MIIKEIGLHIFGASDAGVSTLGRELFKKLAVSVFDFDDYFRKKTNPPYTQKYKLAKRFRLLKETIGPNKSYIISRHYGLYVPQFDDILTHAIFLYIPNDIRLKHLEEREYQDFGNRIKSGGAMHDNYISFTEWSNGYEKTNFKEEV